MKRIKRSRRKESGGIGEKEEVSEVELRRWKRKQGVREKRKMGRKKRKLRIKRNRDGEGEEILEEKMLEKEKEGKEED